MCESTQRPLSKTLLSRCFDWNVRRYEKLISGKCMKRVCVCVCLCVCVCVCVVNSNVSPVFMWVRVCVCVSNSVPKRHTQQGGHGPRKRPQHMRISRLITVTYLPFEGCDRNWPTFPPRVEAV